MGLAQLPPAYKRDNTRYIVWRFNASSTSRSSTKGRHSANSSRQQLQHSSVSRTSPVLCWDQLTHGALGDILHLQQSQHRAQGQKSDNQSTAAVTLAVAKSSHSGLKNHNVITKPTTSTKPGRTSSRQKTGATISWAADVTAAAFAQAADSMAATSQSNIGAPMMRSDNLTSNSVIKPSSSSNKLGDTSDQSGVSQDWLANSSIGPSAWDNKFQAGDFMQNNPHTKNDSSSSNSGSNQFSGWGQNPFPSSSTFNSDATASAQSSWGNSLSNMQSNWGSHSSPSLSKQAAMSDWGASTSNFPPSHNWGMPNPSNSSTDEDSWGQPKRLPNAGTDGWGQPNANLSNPSNTQQQPNHWGQPPPKSSTSSQSPSPTSAWPSSDGTSSGSSVNQQAAAASNLPISNSGSSTALNKQWGANTATASQNATTSMSSAMASEPGSATTANASATTPTSTPTSWAGAAAKGLPKTQPKPVEQPVVDPIQLQIEQTINNPDGWGRVPVRQDTSWGKAPEKKKQDDSNQWQATPNNGTAIWESVKNANGQPDKYEDKSTWTQKVVGNNDPNVWNGEGTKGKDNALWDDVSNDQDNAIDPSNTWNPQPSSRTISQSSGGDNNSESGWTAGPPANSISRTSPPTSNNHPSTPTLPDSGWGNANGNGDPRKMNNWSNNSMGPPRTHSTSDMDHDIAKPGVLGRSNDFIQQPSATATGPAGSHSGGDVIGSSIVPPPAGAVSITTASNIGGGSSSWGDNSYNGPRGNNNSWTSAKPQSSWNGDNGPTGANNWAQPSGWGDGPMPGGGNQWNSGGNKKMSSYGWEDGAGGDFMPRRLKSESDAPRDDDMGDWNESNSVWSSAAGFKQQPGKRPPGTMNENPHMMPGNGRMQGNFGYGNNMSGPGNMGGGGGTGSGGQNQSLTKHQMLNMLMQMGFAKEDAHSALIQNDMNLQGAIADLIKGNGNMKGSAAAIDNSNKFNASNQQHVPPSYPPLMPSSVNANTLTAFNHNNHVGNHMAGTPNMNGQLLRNLLAGPNRHNSAQQQHQQQQQRMIVQQLQLGVQMNNIHPQVLNLPLTEQTVRSIQQLLNLQQTYQQHYDQLMQLQRRNMANPQQVENLNMMMGSIKSQMKSIQHQLLGQQMNKMPDVRGGGPGGHSAAGLDISSMSLNSNQQMQPQSRLGIWTDKGSIGKQGGGNMLGDHSPWSNSGIGSGWSSMSPNSQFLDNQIESQSGSASQSPNSRPSNQNAAAAAASGLIGSIGSGSQSSFDIPEFVPGQPWQGATLPKIEDDPNITPGSVARSLSVASSAITSGGSRSNMDLDWTSSGKGTWSNQSNAIGDSWSKRPPPGFNKNINRSMSMPQGPSEKMSAFSPVGGNWDNKNSLVGGSNWLALRNLTPQIDGATLKTLCSQHGPLLNFFVNQSNGQALVQYASKQEGLKAQLSLNGCVLSNTTIMAEFVDETEVQRIKESCQRSGSMGRSSSMSAAPGSALWPSSTTSASNLWGSSNSLASAAGATSSSTWGSNLIDNQYLSSQDFLATGDF